MYQPHPLSNHSSPSLSPSLQALAVYSPSPSSKPILAPTPSPLHFQAPSVVLQLFDLIQLQLGALDHLPKSSNLTGKREQKREWKNRKNKMIRTPIIRANCFLGRDS